MKFEEALKLREEKKDLIGSISSKGFKTNKLIIVPSNNSKREAFLISYFYDHKQEHIQFKGEDVQLWAIDDSEVEQNGVLFYDIIAK